MSYDEGDDETNLKTSTLNVSTLLGLVAQTAPEPNADATTVIAPAQELRDALAIADRERDARGPADSGVVERAHVLREPPSPPSPTAAPPSSPAPQRASRVVTAAPLASPARPRSRRLRVHARPRRSLRLRVLLLGVLTLIVMSQPWWWNIGDLRSHPTVRTETPPAR